MKKKTAMLLLTFLVIYIFTFFVPRMMPGDPFSYLDYADTDTSGLMSEQHKAVMREYYGMNKPLVTQLLQRAGALFGHIKTRLESLYDIHDAGLEPSVRTHACKTQRKSSAH